MLTKDNQRSLLRIVGAVRRRWRIKLLLRGAAIVAGAAIVVFVLSSWVLERAGFTPAAIFAVRVGAYGAVLLLVARWLVRPLARRVSDEQVALYVEEHEPGLHALLLSALEAESAGQLQPLARRTLERALEECARINDGRALERRDLRRFGGAFAGVAAIALVLTGLQPSLLRHGAGVLLNPFRRAMAARPYAIEVQPGDVTVPRGADVSLRAHLRGFAVGEAQVVVRTGRDSAFQHIAMTRGAAGDFELSLFDLREPAEYFVEAGGVRSGVYRIQVADLPYVKALSLEYQFPAYTGLPAERVEEGGDVAALRGTTVRLFATTTVPAAGGDIVLSTGARLPLRQDSAGAWTGAFRIEGKGFYHLELRTASGQRVTGSPEYAIDVLDDRAPSVRLAKPGRDTRPTPTDEVFVEARAEDDYGIRSIELMYAVNGGPEKSVEVFRSARGLPEAAAGRTLYLEEMGLQPGDIVSYYARARDGSPAGKPVTSDIYFLTIRPFGRDYRQADSGPPQGGGQQGQDAGELTRQQREVVAATFNLARDSAGYTSAAFREYLNTIALMQDRLRAQVLALAQRMRNRQITADTVFARIAEILPQAAGAMDTALAQLRGRGPRPALPPEQRALRQLERAEALYRDVQVQFQQANNSGAGGSPAADDLADLFELELDKLRNQYETVQRGERQQTEQQVDATLEKLRELARRLQQENERLRRMALSQSQAGSGSGGASQRQLAQELEQAARQLERLSREQPDQQPELERAARDLAQAADQLRRGAAQARAGNTADAQQALDRLREATRRIQEQRGSGMERQARDALRRAEQLAEEQRRTGEQMEQAARQGASSAQQRDLIQRRSDQVARTSDLEQDLDRLAAGTRRDQREASRRLQQGADAIRRSNLKEMESFSRNLVRDGASPEAVRQLEGRIGQAMDSVLGAMRGATSAFRPGDEQRLAEGLDRARDLVRGLESMRERTRDAAEAADQRPGGRQPDAQGRDAQGRDAQGRDAQGRDAQGRDAQGRDAQGRDAQARGAQGDAVGGGARGQPGAQRAPAGGNGGPGGAAPPLTPDQVRQLRAEARQRLAEARELRRALGAQGRDVGPLEGVLRGLSELDSPGAYASARDLEKIQAQVVEGMKSFEFALRRALLGEARDRTYLTASDEVPESYRRAVEEYYRRLAQPK